MPVVALDAKIVNKRISTTTVLPTVAPSDDHTDKTWSDTDIYSGEFAVNEADDKLFIRIDDEIFEIGLGAPGSGSGIYGVSNTLTLDHETTLDSNDWNIIIDDPAAGRLKIGRTGAALRPIHLSCPDASPVLIEGFNGSDGQAAFEVYGNAKNIEAATFYNDGDIRFCEVGATTTRGRITIGVTTPIAGNAKVTIKGIDSTSGTVALGTFNSSNQMIIQAQNDRRVGIRSMGSTTQVFNIRGMTADNTSDIANFQQSSGVSVFTFGADGLMKFRLAGPTGGWGSAYNISSTSTSTGTTEQSAAFVISHKQSPTVDGTNRINGLWVQGIKNTAFNSNETSGLYSEGRNTNTGNITRLRGGYFVARNDAIATITNFFAIEASALNFGNGTITNFGGIYIRPEAQTTGTITNHYGILIDRPVNVGATITTTYGIRINENSEGTTNYGIYQDGADAINYFKSQVSIGTDDTPNAEALLQLDATDAAFLIMRMTSAQAGALTAVNGMMLYVTDTDATFTAVGFWGYEGGAWTKL